MKRFLAALQFLTIIPLPSRIKITENDLAKSTVWFPVIGFFLGCILVWINQILSMMPLSPLAVNSILVISLIILNGALHLDGLADTFDGLGSWKNKEEMLKIMRDSRIGTMGVLALIAVILLKIVFLGSLDGQIKIRALLMMGMLSRYGMVFLMHQFPYARRQGGKALIFCQDMTAVVFTRATILSFLISIVILGIWQGILVFLGIVAASHCAGKFFVRRIDGITGDTIGAHNELLEVLVLFLMCLLTSS